MGLRTDVGITHQVRDWGFLDTSAQLLLRIREINHFPNPLPPLSELTGGRWAWLAKAW